MAALVDTNVLVYRFDSRFPEKHDRVYGAVRVVNPFRPPRRFDIITAESLCVSQSS